MSSITAKIVKNLIKIGTFRYRKHHLSLSRNIKFEDKPFKVGQKFEFTQFDLNGTNVELIKQKNCDDKNAIIQFHGGGHTQNMNNIYRKFAKKLCKLTSFPVYSIDYKTGNELVYPSVHDECFTAYYNLTNGVLKNKKIITIGDSFGANTMLSTLLRIRDNNGKMPIGIICVSCYIDLAASGSSYKKNCYRDPSYALPKNQKFEENEKFVRRITPYCGNTSLYDCYLSPAYADYTGFPKTLIQCGDLETAESDNDMLFEKARSNGVDITLTKYEGMWHDFQYFTPFLKECKLAIKEIEYFIKSLSV